MPRHGARASHLCLVVCNGHGHKARCGARQDGRDGGAGGHVGQPRLSDGQDTAGVEAVPALQMRYTWGWGQCVQHHSNRRALTCPAVHMQRLHVRLQAARPSACAPWRLEPRVLDKVLGSRPLTIQTTAGPCPAPPGAPSGRAFQLACRPRQTCPPAAPPSMPQPGLGERGRRGGRDVTQHHVKTKCPRSG